MINIIAQPTTEEPRYRELLIEAVESAREAYDSERKDWDDDTDDDDIEYVNHSIAILDDIIDQLKGGQG